MRNGQKETNPTKGRSRKGYELTDENRVEYYKRQLRLAKSENERLRTENEFILEFLSHRKGVKASIKYKVIYRHREKYCKIHLHTHLVHGNLLFRQNL